jgi:hypothetical protein
MLLHSNIGHAGRSEAINVEKLGGHGRN